MSSDANLPTKQDWIQALNSGTYEQAQDALQHGDGFCCLGVLCDLFGAEWDRSGGCYIPTLDLDYDSGNGAESLICQVLGVTETDATKISTRLVQMNDNEDKSFAEIADWLETNQYETLLDAITTTEASL